ncbi:peptide-methionine (S)-S-oxide reductase [Maribacter sp. 2304DJ31-5]|uniref:peptide-methionine (S)-S-oxide reductase n=1 Tax=Maribacter sp. 2304DJ31-5 TaxID=3386273 RepID=UPI0039BC26F2
MEGIQKIGLGGGCHWCTEAVFLSLKGIEKVEQGFIAPIDKKNDFSEAVIVHYDPKVIGMSDLIAIHLHTHKSTKDHSMRAKYRSAVYYFSEEDARSAQEIIMDLQQGFEEPIITQILEFGTFKPSDEYFHNYYYSDVEKPFCKTYISPKIGMLMQRFTTLVNNEV